MCKIFANDIAMVFHPVSITIKCIWTKYTEDEKKENFSNGKTLSQRSVSINMGILRYRPTDRPTDVLSLVWFVILGRYIFKRKEFNQE